MCLVLAKEWKRGAAMLFPFDVVKGMQLNHKYGLIFVSEPCGQLNTNVSMNSTQKPYLTDATQYYTYIYTSTCICICIVHFMADHNSAMS